MTHNQNEPSLLPEEEYFKRLQTFPTIFRELIDFAEGENGHEVLLEMRKEDDPFFGGRYATHGSTVLMRETFQEFWARHAQCESHIPVDTLNAPPWIFCGEVSSPNVIRHHGSGGVFARYWKNRPENANGEWHAINTLKELPIIESIHTTIALAVDVLIHKKLPRFVEFLGTDEVDK